MICIWAGLPAFGFSSYSWKKKCWHIVKLIEICLVWLQRQLFNSLLIPALYCAVAQWWLLSTGQVNTSPVPSRQSRFYFDSRCHQQPVVTDQWSTAGPSAISSALRLHPSFCLHVTPRPVFPVFSNSSSPSCPLQRQINEGLPWYWWGVVGGGLGWLRRYWSTGVVKDVWCHTGIFF